MRHRHHAPGACRSSGHPRPTDLPGRSPAGGNDRPVSGLPVLEPPHLPGTGDPNSTAEPPEPPTQVRTPAWLQGGVRTGALFLPSKSPLPSLMHTQGLVLEQAPSHLLPLSGTRNKCPPLWQGLRSHPNLQDAPFTLPIWGTFSGDQMALTAGEPQPRAQDSW